MVVPEIWMCGLLPLARLFSLSSMWDSPSPACPLSGQCWQAQRTQPSAQKLRWRPPGLAIIPLIPLFCTSMFHVFYCPTLFHCSCLASRLYKVDNHCNLNTKSKLVRLKFTSDICLSGYGLFNSINIFSTSIYFSKNFRGSFFFSTDFFLSTTFLLSIHQMMDS